MSTAIIESGAIRPLFRLTNGDLYDPDSLQVIERCIRTIVLHDVLLRSHPRSVTTPPILRIRTIYLGKITMPK